MYSVILINYFKVIHLAAEMDFFSTNPKLVYDVNVEGTR